MKKFYFLFLFALIASIGNLYAAEKTVTWNFAGRKSGTGATTSCELKVQSGSASGTWKISASENFTAQTGSGSTSVTLGSKKAPCTDAKLELTNSPIPEGAQIKKVSITANTNNAKGATFGLQIGGVSSETTLTFDKTKTTQEFTESKVGNVVLVINTLNQSNVSLYSISITYEEVAETKCAKPTFNLENGKTYTDAQTLVITSTTADATIHYTINRGEEKTGQPAEFTENGEYTVDAWATKDNLTESDHASIKFTIAKKCAAPTFTPAAGFLKLGNAITFTSATADAEVYYQYSYNGGEYTSFVKGTSFTPDKEGTFKIIAKATKTGFEDGVSEEQIYEVGNLVFYESFDKNDGTGGNDGQWSGNIATNDIQYDVTGWTCPNASGANKCAKFGTSSKKGTATTPALTDLEGDAILTFKAAPWNTEGGKMSVTISDGTIETSEFELINNTFTEYSVKISGGATSKITFTSSEYRFFLDEVKVKQVAVATPTITPNGGDVKVGDKITFATKTDGATLSYSTDGGQTWTPGSEYTATTVGALNLWVKATKGSDESAVAKATFNVVDPNAIGSVNINITADKTAKTGELFGTMTVAVPMPINATVMDVVIKKDGKEFSSDTGLTAEFSKEITETGTYEIDVTANNDKEIIGDKKTAEFYSNKLTDIADFLLYGPECNNLFGSDVVYEFTCPLSVTYANGSNLWVTDGTDGMLIFQRGGFSTAYTNGTVFAKGIKGQYTVYNNTIELTEPVLTETTEGATVDPKQIEIAAISADNQNQFVIIKDAVLNVKNETFADAAGNTVDMYDKKFCTVPADGTYDVVGIVSYYGYSEAEAATQVYPLAFLTAPTATLGFTAAEINEMPWLAANDIVLTEDGSFENMNASCVKLTCEEGAQIEYTLDSGEPSPSTATVESGTEIGFTDGESYMLTVCAVKGGYKSASREYLFSIGKTSSVSSMSVDGVKVFAAEGGVEVVADEAAEVAVYTAAGQLVRQARVAEGSTLVNVAPGFYVVRANGTATKVIVR